jgi:hypothetical protein
VFKEGNSDADDRHRKPVWVLHRPQALPNMLDWYEALARHLQKLVAECPSNTWRTCPPHSQETHKNWVF